MNVRGLQKLTLLDYPGQVACTVFTGGCNFRCPFCHNRDLVLTPNGPGISEEDFFNFLKKRTGILDGVCVGSSTVESLANAHKPQRCGVFLSNFIYFYVACVACLWYNGFEVMTLETIF